MPLAALFGAEPRQLRRRHFESAIRRFIGAVTKALVVLRTYS